MKTPRAGVLAAACPAPSAHRGPGRVVMFVAARAGEGVSHAARLAAEEAAAPVLLADLDIKRSVHARHYADRLGAPTDARANGAAFWRIKDESGVLLRGQLVTRRSIIGSEVDVLAIDSLPPGARVQVGPDPAYWNALRAAGALTVVDAPALARAPLALKLAPHMDAVVLVVSADPGAAPPAIEARAALTEAGANVIGIVFARASAPVMALDRLTRQAG